LVHLWFKLNKIHGHQNRTLTRHRMKCGQNHPNKLTSEIKERLQSVIESTMESIRIDDMNTNQKLKLLQLGLQYIIPKLTSTTIHEEDSCIDEPIFIEVLKRKEDSD
jgi:hypothetical protein